MNENNHVNNTLTGTANTLANENSESTQVASVQKENKDSNTYFFHDIEAHSPLHNAEPVETPIVDSSRSRFDSGMDEDEEIVVISKLIERRPDYQPNSTPLHERDPHEFTVIIIGGMALAFNSGFINGAAVASYHSISVTHVTGTTTIAALALASSNYEQYAIRMAIISCFIFGSGITGAMMPQNSFQLGREYGPLFIIGSCLLLFACITAYAAPESYWYYYFAAMASGLQNAMSTKYSGNIIRTTHLTGTATDIGLVLGRLIVRRETKEVWKLQVLIPLTFGFFMGGFVAHYATVVMGRYALLVSVLLFFLVGLAYSVFVAFRFSVPIWRILFGSYRFIQKKTKEHTSKVSSAVKDTFSDIKRKRFHNHSHSHGKHSHHSNGSLTRPHRSNSHAARALKRSNSGNATSTTSHHHNGTHNHNSKMDVGAIELVDGKHYPHDYSSLNLHDSSV